MSGIDILGNIMESSTLSINRNFYGDLHNFGHVFISYAHDPDHRHLESFGVIGDSSTAMRDPAFYRWHAHVNSLFLEHKERLPSYTRQVLDYPGIQVNSISVRPQQGNRNTFYTYWQQSDVDLSRGVDFTPRGSVFARFTHLQHTEFEYEVRVNNTTGRQLLGTCRIFLAPRNDERGTRMLFRDQRSMMTEMDKFTIARKLILHRKFVGQILFCCN